MDQEILDEMLWETSPEVVNSSARLLLLNSQSRRLTNEEQTCVAAASFPVPSSRHMHGQNNQTGAVIVKIEDLFESMIDCIIGHKNELEICLRTRRKAGNQTLDSDTGAIRDSNASGTHKITFPGKTQREAWKFAALLRILELSHEALVNGVVTTKRDIYYKDPELFVKQEVVDRYVDDLAFTFGIPRDALNVVAAAKGLITGALSLLRKDGTILDCSVENEGFLIPTIKDIDRIHIPDTKWILVIEKEATFRTLATSRHWQTSTAGNGILITGKGYPDIQTRAFLRLLSIQQPSVPIFSLMDFDPDGFGILSTYKHGSTSLAHQNEILVVPRMHWLGIHSSDICSGADGSDGQRQLTIRDRRLATRMLEKEVFQEEIESTWRRELQVMLFLNIKAEIQITSNKGTICSWLNTRMSAVKYISESR